MQNNQSSGSLPCRAHITIAVTCSTQRAERRCAPVLQHNNRAHIQQKRNTVPREPTKCNKQLQCCWQQSKGWQCTHILWQDTNLQHILKQDTIPKCKIPYGAIPLTHALHAGETLLLQLRPHLWEPTQDLLVQRTASISRSRFAGCLSMHASTTDTVLSAYKQL